MFWIWFVLVVGVVAGAGYLYDRKHRGHSQGRTTARPMEGSVGAGNVHLNYGQANITPPISGDPSDR